MRKIIGVGLLLAVLYIIQSTHVYYEYADILGIAILVTFVYLIFVIIQFVVRSLKKPAVYNPQNTVAPQSSAKKTSGCLWIIGLVAVAAFVFYLKEILGRQSFNTFLFFDNLVKVSQSIPPYVGWGLLGLLVGAIYGSVVAWKKYKLNFSINLIPVGVFILVVAILVMVNSPFSNYPDDNSLTQSGQGMDATNDSPKKLIINRWEIVDITGKNRKNLKQRKSKTKSELEFKDNGKCYLYENGVTTGFVYYTISPDGKSMLFTDSRKKDQTTQLEIVSITKNELMIKSAMFGNETATLRAE